MITTVIWKHFLSLCHFCFLHFPRKTNIFLLEQKPTCCMRQLCEEQAQLSVQIFSTKCLVQIWFGKGSALYNLFVITCCPSMTYDNSYEWATSKISDFKQGAILIILWGLEVPTGSCSGNEYAQRVWVLLPPSEIWKYLPFVPGTCLSRPALVRDLGMKWNIPTCVQS